MRGLGSAAAPLRGAGRPLGRDRLLRVPAEVLLDDLTEGGLRHRSTFFQAPS